MCEKFMRFLNERVENYAKEQNKNIIYKTRKAVNFQVHKNQLKNNKITSNLKALSQNGKEGYWSESRFPRLK
jgi:hypothetical protein